MKKTIVLLLAALMLFSASAFAAEFTPSAEAKEVIPAVVVDERGEVVQKELIITPVSQAIKAQAETPTDVAEPLIEAYETLKNTETLAEVIPGIAEAAEKFGVTPEVLVVRDVFKVDFEPDGTAIRVKFDIKIEPDAPFVVIAYKDGKFFVIPDEFVIRNEDGSITLIMDEPLSIAFLVDNGSIAFTSDDEMALGVIGDGYVPSVDPEAPTSPLTGANEPAYGVILAGAAALIVTAVLFKKKKQA
jgi:hypothetical protein